VEILNIFKFCSCLTSSHNPLEFVIENQDEGATSTSDNVGQGTLEESLTTFILIDLFEAVNGTSVHDVSSTRLHHKSSSDGIQRIRDETSSTGDELSNQELKEDASILVITEDDSLQSVVTTEVSGSVYDNTGNGDTKTSVETDGTIGGVDLLQTVDKTIELSVITLSDISSKSGSGEIEGVDEHEGSGTSSTTGGKRAQEIFEGFGLGVVWAEDLLVCILEGEVKSLSGEVSDDVGKVSSPESGETFLLGDSDKDIDDTLVFLITLDLRRGILGLEKELDSFDGSDSGLGDGSRDTTHKEILKESGHVGLL